MGSLAPFISLRNHELLLKEGFFFLINYQEYLMTDDLLQPLLKTEALLDSGSIFKQEKGSLL